MKVIFLALVLGTATSALPTASNTFLVEHETSTATYSVILHAMVGLAGGLMVGLNRYTSKKIGPFIKEAMRRPRLGMGRCCICLEGNLENPSEKDSSEKVPVILLHGFEDNMQSHGCCANCLKGHVKINGGRHPVFGRKPVTCPAGCKRKIPLEDPTIKEALNG